MSVPAAKKRVKTFHATMQVTRIEQWYIEAEDETEARKLLERGEGRRSQIGECVHFEIDTLAE